MKFISGFTFENIPYGWYEKELYRLPYTNKHNMKFSLKKMGKILIGRKKGYRLSQRSITIDYLEGITEPIDFEFTKVLDSNCPFG
jgi:hypothetical protein